MHTLDALGNSTRRAILSELRDQPLSVGDLASRFPVSRPAISRHLRILEIAGLVESHSEGTRSLYVVRYAGLNALREYLDEFWDAALRRLEAIASGEAN